MDLYSHRWALPKYLWVSYINASIHAISRAELPFPKLVGSKNSVYTHYAGKFNIYIVYL